MDRPATRKDQGSQAVHRRARRRKRGRTAATQDSCELRESVGPERVAYSRWLSPRSVSVRDRPARPVAARNPALPCAALSRHDRLKKSALARPSYGLIVTTTTPCDSTFAANLPVNFPKSLCAHRSRRFAETFPGYPIASHGTEISASLALRFSSTTARLPSFNCLDQISRSPSFHTRLP